MAAMVFSVVGSETGRWIFVAAGLAMCLLVGLICLCVKAFGGRVSRRVAWSAAGMVILSLVGLAVIALQVMLGFSNDTVK